jgi:predicted dienelactone hydrolase
MMRTVVFITIALAALGLAAPSRAGAGQPVGVTTLTFTKTSVTTGAPRPLATLVWYPAKARTGVAEALGLRDAAVRPGRYPLIVFSHGNCGRPREATYLTKELAAEGFVVAALPHPGNTADDSGCLAAFGDSFVNRVPDVRFVLDAMLAQATDPSSLFHRRIRTDRLGMSGLSFGGFTTLLSAQQEPRFDAAFALVPGGAAVLDPRGISIPTLVIGSERDRIVPFPESEAAYERLVGPRYLVKLLGANHLSAVDDCFNQDLHLDLCVPGDISQDDAHRLILRYALPFFRRYLRGDHAAGKKLLREAPGVTLLAEPRRSAG